MKSLERNLTTGRYLKTHGLTHTRIYSIWAGIKNRCFNKKKSQYASYGGRGIVMCDEWKDDFMSFYTWSMNNGYTDDLSIDRIDNSKGYSPDNCRWVDKIVQSTNRRVTNFVDINGEKYTIPQLSRMYGINKYMLYARARSMGYVKEILDIKEKKTYLYRGKEYTLTELSRFTNLSPQTLKSRIDKGWDMDDVVKPISEINHGGKRVCQYDISGNLIGEYDSIRKASIRTGVCASAISNCLHGRYRTAGGFTWLFKSMGEQA